MRLIPQEIQDALDAGHLMARDFITITARNRSTGAPHADSFWSDVGTIQAQVIDPDTGLTENRTFIGAGTLVSVDAIPAVSNLTIQTVNVRMSQVHDRVQQLIRTYDVKQAKIEIFRGLFNPNSRQMVAPAEPRFVGFVDQVEVTTPSVNGDGAVSMSCVSHSREINRFNPDTRSDESQKRRSPTDNFYQDTAVVGEWELFWGKEGGTVA